MFCTMKALLVLNVNGSMHMKLYGNYAVFIYICIFFFIMHMDMAEFCWLDEA